MDHLKYCTAEILAAKELLTIPNSSFYCRGIGRIVAVRLDDFIKLAFRVNKANARSKRIKDDLNTLENLYKTHLKQQRDKFGAHFQELDLATRIESWQAINYESMDFFTDLPSDLYSAFAGHIDYVHQSLLFTPLSANLFSAVEVYNQQNELERHPTAGVDALALTRPNTAAMIALSNTHNKIGTLKAIEIIIKYNSGLLKIVESSTAHGELVKKMLITDVVSYADNLVSRADVAPGAPQDEKGLNTLLDEDGFDAAKERMQQFLNSFKFEESLSGYREIRNKCCGHIDTSTAVAQLTTDLNTLDISEMLEFYDLLKKTLAEICSCDFRFKMYLIEPGTKINDAMAINGLEDLKSFDGSPYSQITLSVPDLNNIMEYDNHFQRIKQNDDEDSLKYFHKCLAGSAITHKERLEYKNDFSTSISQVDIRKAHIYFKDILQSTAPTTDKTAVLKIFQYASNGYPDTLLKILLDTYASNSHSFEMKIGYFYLFGELCQKEQEKTVALLYQGLKADTLAEIYNSALALLKIDVSPLRNQGNHTEATKISEAVIGRIRNMNQADYRLVIAVGLLSHIYYNEKIFYARKKIIPSYIAPLKRIVQGFLDTELPKLQKNDTDKRCIKRIKSNFNNQKYSSFYAELGTFYKNKNKLESSEKCQRFLYDGYIIFNRTNYAEMHNYAYICYKMSDFNKAVLIMESQMTMHPSNCEIKYELLKFYRCDEKYRNKFDLLKIYVLDKFNLKTKLRRDISKLHFTD